MERTDGKAISSKRDPRFITVRRGSALSDADHRLLALWAADRAQHVLHPFERTRPGDDHPRLTIEGARAWTRGEITMSEPRTAAFAAHASAVAHMADHELGAAAYALRAVRSSRPENRDEAGRLERRWQREQLPVEVHELVLDDQRIRNNKFWSLFDP